MELRIFKESSARIPRQKLERLFAAIVAHEFDPAFPSHVNAVFVDDDRIRELNREFRSLDRPTDVLSFVVDDIQVAGGTFGEIYISTDRAREQAATYNVTLTDELLRLFAHGMLHLAGWDHEDEESLIRMQSRENFFLRQLESGGAARG